MIELKDEYLAKALELNDEDALYDYCDSIYADANDADQLFSELSDYRILRSRPALSFAKWTHPTTGEVRIYLSDVPMLASSTKVYLTRRADGCWIYTIVASTPQERRSAEQAMANIHINHAIFDTL